MMKPTEKVVTTLSTDMNIYGNKPSYPLSYNYNVLRFRTERCLNAKVQPGQPEKTAEVCTASPVYRIRKSKFALCITCIQCAKIQNGVFYDVSWFKR